MFDRLLGRSPKPPANALAVVRNITLGRTVVLDPLAWRRLGTEASFKMDRDTLEISAQGRISLDAGGYVHRFYTDDHPRRAWPDRKPMTSPCLSPGAAAIPTPPRPGGSGMTGCRTRSGWKMTCRPSSGSGFPRTRA
ncbi:MAG: DUF2491 family protein, partial [Caulobacteraceae bacterium]|nr:DUF2491 family protein [Caulobacteraceae bacterium]